MIECTDLFWHEFYKGAGITLGVLLPLGLIWGGMMLAVFRQNNRHQERMQEARLREEQARSAHYRQAS
jgi:hypothetical protein